MTFNPCLIALNYIFSLAVLQLKADPTDLVDNRSQDTAAKGYHLFLHRLKSNDHKTDKLSHLRNNVLHRQDNVLIKAGRGLSYTTDAYNYQYVKRRGLTSPKFKEINMPQLEKLQRKTRSTNTNNFVKIRAHRLKHNIADFLSEKIIKNLNFNNENQSDAKFHNEVLQNAGNVSVLSNNESLALPMSSDANDIKTKLNKTVIDGVNSNNKSSKAMNKEEVNKKLQEIWKSDFKSSKMDVADTMTVLALAVKLLYEEQNILRDSNFKLQSEITSCQGHSRYIQTKVNRLQEWKLDSMNQINAIEQRIKLKFISMKKNHRQVQKNIAALNQLYIKTMCHICNVSTPDSGMLQRTGSLQTQRFVLQGNKRFHDTMRSINDRRKRSGKVHTEQPQNTFMDLGKLQDNTNVLNGKGDREYNMSRGDSAGTEIVTLKENTTTATVVKWFQSSYDLTNKSETEGSRSEHQVDEYLMTNSAGQQNERQDGDVLYSTVSTSATLKTTLDVSQNQAPNVSDDVAALSLITFTETFTMNTSSSSTNTTYKTDSSTLTYQTTSGPALDFQTKGIDMSEATLKALQGTYSLPSTDVEQIHVSTTQINDLASKTNLSQDLMNETVNVTNSNLKDQLYSFFFNARSKQEVSNSSNVYPSYNMNSDIDSNLGDARFVAEEHLSNKTFEEIQSNAILRENDFSKYEYNTTDTLSALFNDTTDTISALFNDTTDTISALFNDTTDTISALFNDTNISSQTYPFLNQSLPETTSEPSNQKQDLEFPYSEVTLTKNILDVNVTGTEIQINGSISTFISNFSDYIVGTTESSIINETTHTFTNSFTESSIFNVTTQPLTNSFTESTDFNNLGNETQNLYDYSPRALNNSNQHSLHQVSTSFNKAVINNSTSSFYLGNAKLDPKPILEERVKVVEQTVIRLVSTCLNISSIKQENENKSLNLLKMLTKQKSATESLTEEFRKHKTETSNVRSNVSKHYQHSNTVHTEMRNKTLKLGQELKEQGAELQHLHAYLTKTSLMLTKLASQIRMSKMVSTVMSDMATALSKLEDRMTTVHNASQRSFRHLQGHVINLNNSMQDLSERIFQLSNKRQQELSIQSLDKSRTLLDNLNIQLLFNANRLSNLETAMLNHSMRHCGRTNTELLQEVKLYRLEEQVKLTKEEVVQLQDRIKSLEASVGRLQVHGKTVDTKLSQMLRYAPVSQRILSHVTELKNEVDNLILNVPKDCQEYFTRGQRNNGSYAIYLPDIGRTQKIYCIMISDKVATQNSSGHGVAENAISNSDANEDTFKSSPITSTQTADHVAVHLQDQSDQFLTEDDNTRAGGWTVIQRRVDGSVNFTVTWEEYTRGFGDPSRDYWAGNNFIHAQTWSSNHELWIKMEDINSEIWEVRYDTFKVSSENDNYRLLVAGYKGNATDALRYSNTMAFSTMDRDNDDSASHCAEYNGGGWWYSQCHVSNLNGPFSVGMVWYNTEGKDWIQLKSTIMMIRQSRRLTF
ncbi:BpsFReDn10 [Biomphalaria pfeifferi]|uniref:BpsFReDn10 n=1 Tax=Biomphalaria pfeifferi TaxID=112525 RepID=A0AAD8B212_BIOPF|nr:BpsFReDn10 [Biomphalaria pfeifferi]